MPHDHEEIQRSLGRIEGKLDTAIKGSSTHEDRLQNLEKSRSWLRGIAAAISVTVAAAWALILKKL